VVRLAGLLDGTVGDLDNDHCAAKQRSRTRRDGPFWVGAGR